MYELEQFVDQLLGGVQAESHRKEEIRRELLNHLHGAYTEELESGEGNETALRRAVERMGSVQSLRQELQAGIPFSDFVTRAARREMIVFLLQGLMLLPLLLVTSLDIEMHSANAQMLSIAQSLIIPLFAAQVTIAFNLFLIGLFMDWIRCKTRRSSLMTAAISFSTGLVILLASGSLFALLSGASLLSLTFVIRWSMLSAGGATACAILASWGSWENKQLRSVENQRSLSTV